VEKVRGGGGRGQVVGGGGRRERLEQARRGREAKVRASKAEKRRIGAPGTAPKRVAALGITASADPRGLLRLVARAAAATGRADQGEDDAMGEEEGMGVGWVAGDGGVTVVSGAMRQRLSLQAVVSGDDAGGDMRAVLHASQCTDVLLVVMRVGDALEDGAEARFRVMRSQGPPTAIGVLQGLGEVPLKKRHEVRKAAAAFFAEFATPEARFACVDTVEEARGLLRMVAEGKVQASDWQRGRPMVVAEGVELAGEAAAEATSRGGDAAACDVAVTGYVRNRALSANQVVHVTGVGSFSVRVVEALADPCPFGRGGHSPGGGGQEARVVSRPVEGEVEPIVLENETNPLEGEQTWPTQEELMEAEGGGEGGGGHKGRRIPKGWGKYQAAWIDHVDDEDVSESEGEGEGEDEDDEARHQREAVRGILRTLDDEDREDAMSLAPTEGTMAIGEDEEDEELGLEELARLRAAQRQARREQEERDGEEFPDEIDTPMEVAARERFARYRGIKSFRDSKWDAKESLPEEYGRIFQFESFRKAAKRALRPRLGEPLPAADVPVKEAGKKIRKGEKPGAMESSAAMEEDDPQGANWASVGTYVRVVLADVPLGAAQLMRHLATSTGLCCTGLLKFETRLSVLNLSVQKVVGAEEPVRSKDELVFHLGFRQFSAKPVFSEDTFASKHRFCRFLRPHGEHCVATVYGPISYPPSPALAFRRDPGTGALRLVASGHVRDANPDRIVLKRYVLSGYPFKVQKKRATVRFMFWSPEDVRWFKPIELYTKHGRRGRIRDSVGTHGTMKCSFDGVIHQHDTVCMAMYKRVFPKRVERGTWLAPMLDEALP